MPAALDTSLAPARAERLPGGVRELVALALPIVLTNLSATVMMATDAAMVGRLGATELGAVGLAGIWYWTALSGFSGAATGVQTFVAQAQGAGDERAGGRWAWQGWYAIAPLATLVMTAFALGFAPLLDLMAPAPALRPLAADYVEGRAIGIVGVITAMVLGAFFRGTGDARTPLWAMLAANAVNLFLNFALIYGMFGFPAWGVYGAGVATAVAQWVDALLLLYFFRRRGVARRFHTAPVAPARAEMRRFLRTSAPIGGQWMLDMIAFALFSTVVARMGVAEMAASQALINLMQLSFMLVIGIQVAVATLVGRYVGAGDLAAAWRSRASALQVGLALSVVAAVAFLSVPEFCLRLFTSDPEVLRLGSALLVVGAAFQVVDAVGVLNGGALRGAGDTRWPFVVQTLLAWGLFLPAAWLCGVWLEGGLTGAWLGGVVYVFALGVALHWRFQSGVWQRTRI